MPQDTLQFPSGIRDNRERGTVGEFLQSQIENGSSLSVVSAYFTIYAFEALKSSLLEINDLRFLFGEPQFIKRLDPDRTEKKSFVIDSDGLQLENQLQLKRVARECAEWIEEKVEIRSIQKKNLLHGKMYHIDNNGVEKAILGSSNFTVRGLGLGAGDGNIELNLKVEDNRDVNDLKQWFNELWYDEKQVVDVKEEVLSYLNQIYENYAPEFVYYKTLYHLFERYLSDQEGWGLLDEPPQLVDTQIWNALYGFQKDGVKGAINKILTHNGCIIADSVGLGKTYEALAVIKYFELRNENVLVLCPKKLRENWTMYPAYTGNTLNPFSEDRFGYTVLSHTDLSRADGMSGDVDLSSFNWGNYGLVVIDESHNFRNNTRGKRDEDGNRITRSRYERLMEDIVKSGVNTKMLLLSATPVNNDLRDLRNQLYFLTEERDDAFKDSLGVANLKETISSAQTVFNKWAKQDGGRSSQNLLDELSTHFFKLLDGLTIARSRKQIQKYYPDSMKELGGFPKRGKPESIYTKIDLENEFLPYDRLNDEISEYQLSLYNPTKYLRPEYESEYDLQHVRNFTQSDREHFLIGMMKVNFLKRLESSVHSFRITLERTLDKIEDLEQRIRRFQQFREENPDLDPAEMEIDAGDDEELQAALEVGKSLIFKMAHLDVERWLEDLQRDREQLERPLRSAEKVNPNRDAKLARLKRLIQKKVENPSTTKKGIHNRKVLVFTAFADTADYLYGELHEWAEAELGINTGMVTGGAMPNRTTLGKTDFTRILTNFSPIAKNRDHDNSMPQDEEIDLLIGTDCISEGQNLQDCDYLINYDIHWNPVRIIQRFGRIDRIGSVNRSVHLVNFWPTPDLNRYINLKNRVEARMALVDVTAAQGDNLLDPDALSEAIEGDLKYRDQQLLKLQEEILDLEEFNESVSLNEFTLDDFRMELIKYIESNKKKLEEAPFGLYAVVPPPAGDPIIQPGVIFCLKQIQKSEENEKLNPTHPYFLVYVREDGEVRFTFAQPKQILEMYRQLCETKTGPYDELCALFDEHTDNGADMSGYDKLLREAVRSISHTYEKRAFGSLRSGRGGVLPLESEQVGDTTDFELVTWLVIKDESSPMKLNELLDRVTEYNIHDEVDTGSPVGREEW